MIKFYEVITSASPEDAETKVGEAGFSLHPNSLRHIMLIYGAGNILASVEPIERGTSTRQYDRHFASEIVHVTEPRARVSVGDKRVYRAVGHEAEITDGLLEMARERAVDIGERLARIATVHVIEVEENENKWTRATTIYARGRV